jgi:hypothetical protein
MGLQRHKPDYPLISTDSSTDSPCYALADVLHKTLSSLVENTDPLVKDCGQFLKLVQDFNLQNEKCLVSNNFGLFTNISVEAILQVRINRLNTDLYFLEHSPLQVEL